jgi:hypothetical protein
MMPVILTASGKYFDFNDPQPETIDIEDIATALSRICRFTGHTEEFYSVAQHSVLVSQLVPREHALAGLLHDAAEAYLGDVSSPLKQMLPDYKAIEHRVEAAVFAAFGIEFPLDPCIKQADLKMLVTERRDLMPYPSYSYHGIDKAAWYWTESIEACPGYVFAESSEDARNRFLDRYDDLTR